MTAPTKGRVVPLDGSVVLDKEVLGGKAWSIVAMRRLGLPVPPAFALPVDECRRYHEAGNKLDDEVWRGVIGGVRDLERATGQRFGDPSAPMLVSVRSGAAVSMPGMMDTVLDLGINDQVEQGLAELSGDPLFARDTHARFCAQFGRIVLSADIEPHEEQDSSADQVRAAVLEDVGESISQDPYEQLRAAICAVFDSWGSRRAVAYRKHWNISELGGTAVTVQVMAFGNLDDRSGTGVLFTRNPLNGDRKPFGEWLPRGQGEDVVSGTRAVLPITDLADRLPAVYSELLDAARILERARGDVQDIEFTIEHGNLYLLQTRTAKRSPGAAVRLAVDMVREGVIEPTDAIQRVTADQAARVLAPQLTDHATEQAEVLARGVAACPGVAAGPVCREIASTEEATVAGSVLARPTTSPDDVPSMIAAAAVVTELGGTTSHAAVVTRALGRPSVVGVGVGVTDGWEGRTVTVDGTSGLVYAGSLDTQAVDPTEDPDLVQLLVWAEESCPVTVGPTTDEVFDLDRAGVGLEPEAGVDRAVIAEQLTGHAAAQGAVLATTVGAAAALDAGVRTVVPVAGQDRLVLLLRLVEAQGAPDRVPEPDVLE